MSARGIRKSQDSEWRRLGWKKLNPEAAVAGMEVNKVEPEVVVLWAVAAEPQAELAWVSEQQ